MTVVCNTGPLIALAKTDHLWVLERLFGKVIIPGVVHHELLAKFGTESERLERAFMAFVQVQHAFEKSTTVEFATQGLDAGERDAVALAYLLNLPLIIDDRLGRKAAQNLGLTVSGVVGVLVLARLQSLIPSASQVAVMMREQGYWLSDALIAHAQQEESE